MICATCGRENPPHLPFCQECGQRLHSRIASATPPILGDDDRAQQFKDLLERAVGDSRAAAATAATAPATAPQNANANANGAQGVRCPVCETPNPAGLRYCTTCGNAVGPQSQTGAPGPVDAAPVDSTGPTVEAPLRASISPMRVVAVGGATPANAARTCSRCHGFVEPRVPYCRFCGAELSPESAPATHEEPPRAFPREHREAPRFDAFDAPAPAAPPAPAQVGVVRPAREAQPKVPAGRLVVIAKSGADGASYPIGETLDIGRTEGHVLIGEDPYLSPRHARLTRTKQGFVLWDLGSTNGVYLRLAKARALGGPRRAGSAPASPDEVAVPLQDQDLILVGQQVLRFEVDTERDGGPGPATEHGTLVFGSPATPRYAHLAQRTVEGVTRDVYYVQKVETVLGRESGDVVFAEDPFLSRRHAAVRVLADQDGRLLPMASGAPERPRFTLVDLGSSNGTFLRIRGDVELVSGDQFRVGQQLFRVDFETPGPRDGARAERAG